MILLLLIIRLILSKNSVVVAGGHAVCSVGLQLSV